jgi:hypothetical protein
LGGRYPSGVSEPTDANAPPPEIGHLVRQRMEARARRDWPAADALKSQIEAAGWVVVDRGFASTVRRAAPASTEVDSEVRYGSAADVPSLLDEPATAPWTVALVASEDPQAVSRLLAALRAHAPAGTQVVAVANDPSDAQAAALALGSADRAPVRGRDVEVLRTATRLGYAAALNAALRRAAGELILLADGSALPKGDALTPLGGTLADREVAAAGAFGLVSSEPGRLRPGALELSSSAEAGALLSGWLAFRRSDYVALGPLDEQFVTPAWLDVWLSLRLRAGPEPNLTPEAERDIEAEPDAGAEAGAEAEPEAPEAEPEAPGAEPSAEPEPVLAPPRRTVRLDLPLEGPGPAWPPDRSRLNRRNMYRVLDRFGWRPDLF